MKTHLFSALQALPALLFFSIKSATAAPWTNGGLPGNVVTDSPCSVIQGAQLLGCQLKSDCLGGGPGRAYLEGDVCTGSNKCCYNNIPCVQGTGNICMNNGETSCIGGLWQDGNCPTGAGGNLQCCNIPRVSSFHSTDEQTTLEYFKLASVPDLPLTLPQGSNLEQQSSEGGSSADGLNGLDQYAESGQAPAMDYGLNLHSPTQPVTGNNLISYSGPPAGGSDYWAGVLE